MVNNLDVRLNEIDDFLKDLKKRTVMHVGDRTSKSVASYLSGFRQGIVLCDPHFSFSNWVDAGIKIRRLRGWYFGAQSALGVMQEKGLAEDFIVPELVEIEREIWKEIGRELKAD